MASQDRQSVQLGYFFQQESLSWNSDMEKADSLIGCFARLVIKGKWTKELEVLEESWRRFLVQPGVHLRSDGSEEP